MTNPSPTLGGDAKPGALSQALIRIFMRRADISGCEDLGERFRLIRLAGPELCNVSWTPGEKVQIAMGSAFTSRTYTPIEWDAKNGASAILAYAHGEGPGSEWIRTVAPGQRCDVFGPRSSLNVGDLSGQTIIFGDETSLGLAIAAQRANPGKPVRCLLEVDSVADVQGIVTMMDLANAELFERQAGDSHLDAIVQILANAASPATSFFLTGKAGSIQRLRQALRELGGSSAPRIATKAYWAPGKKGLD